MRNKTYIPALCIALFMLIFSSCSSDDNFQTPNSGEQKIELSATTFGAEAINTENLYLAAMLADDPTKIYFGETLIEIPGLTTSEPNRIKFPLGAPSYPLANIEINMFAYTGRAKGHDMQLQSGVGGHFDAIVSNNGTRQSAPTIDPAKEGLGIVGSSSDPAKTLEFRHAMTQIIVEVKVDMSESPNEVNPIPQRMQIGMQGLVDKGLYSINSKAPVEGDEANATVATATSGNYQLKLGTNYVVPTGENLKGKAFTSLLIDDYIATSDDLKDFVVQPEGSAGDFYLLSGYSYKLTLTISRLKLIAINLAPTTWQKEIVNDKDLSYDSYQMNLDLGRYTNAGEDLVTKAILHTKDNKTYVGGAKFGTNNLHFVTVPATNNVNSVELYTDKGLLLKAPINGDYKNNGNTVSLTLKLSKAGMFAENANQSMSATNPYMVTTPLQFLNIDKELSAHYKQDKLIDMSSLNIKEFKGLGKLEGSYDGNNHGITSLYINGAGVFKENNGIVKDMRIYQGNINTTGAEFAGAFVGVNNGTVVSCYNSAIVSGSTKTVGGIVGKNSATGIVLANVNNGEVSAGEVVGGIVGTNENTNQGAISACVNIGSLSRNAQKLGGIAGTSKPSANSLLNSCYWLIGSAERYIGSKESAVDSDGVGRTNTSSRDVNELRNGISEGDTEEDRIVNKLNAEIANFPQWKDTYHYILDRDVTGSTWPISIKK